MFRKWNIKAAAFITSAVMLIGSVPFTPSTVLAAEDIVTETTAENEQADTAEEEQEYELPSEMETSEEPTAAEELPAGTAEAAETETAVTEAEAAETAEDEPALQTPTAEVTEETAETAGTASEETIEVSEPAEEKETAEAAEETDAVPEEADTEETETVPEVAEEAAETETADTEEEEEILMPAWSFNGYANCVSVHVEAPEGAFPTGTKMRVKGVEKSEVFDIIDDATESDLIDVRAVDISFFDTNDKEIWPLVDISVELRADGLNADDEIQVAHIDDDDNVEILEGAEVEGTTCSFDTSDFSVYAVIAGGGTTPRLTVKFYGRDTSSPVAEIPVKKGDDLSTVLYDPGAGESVSGEAFKGWTADAAYTVATEGKTIDGIRADVQTKVDALTDADSEVSYYAMLFRQIRITYLDETGTSLGWHTIENRADAAAASSPYIVNMAYTPVDDEHDFQGWLVSEGKENIEGYTEGKAYANGTEITVSGDVVFSVNAPAGHWLIFNENGEGATYNAPVFVLAGAVTEEPSIEMKRKGYKFGGWYREKECTNAFAFGSTLDEKTTVYAKWTPENQAEYNVIIWLQNATATDYDFKETIALTGTVGQKVSTVSERGSGDSAYARVNGKDKKYTGFHLDSFDRDVTINPEGNTVVNVYYKRNKITYNFYTYSRRQGRWNLSQSMSGLYGSTLAENSKTWPADHYWYDKGYGDGGSDYPDYWYTYPGDIGGTRTTFLDAFLPSDSATTVNFYGSGQGDGDAVIIFYKQKADKSGYDVANTVYTTAAEWSIWGSSTPVFSITDKYSGYAAYQYRVDGGNWRNVGKKNASTGVYGEAIPYDSRLEIRFNRLDYSINFMDGAYFDGDGNPVSGKPDQGQLRQVDGISLGADISSHGEYVPAADKTPAGFGFEGWYADESCTIPYTFMTMPEGGVTVYARWHQIQYRVFLHPNAGTDTTLDWGSDDQKMTFRVTSGEKISTPVGQRNGYAFVGWYTDEACTKVFNADAFVLNETTVTTPYDKATHFTDPMDKWGNGATTNADTDRAWITREFNLYAKWRKVLDGAEGIGLLYDAGDGSGAPADSNLYVDGAMAITGAAATAPAGKQFDCWALQSWNGSAFEDTGMELFPGDRFEVLEENAHKEEKTVDGNKVVTYTVQLKAKYVDLGEPVKTKIKYDANGGSFTGGVATEYEVVVNAEHKTLAASSVTRENYQFVEWNTEADGSGTGFEAGLEYVAADLRDLDKNSKNNTLYAVWAPTVSVEVTGSSAEKEYSGAEQKNETYTVTFKCGGEVITEEALQEMGVTVTRSAVKKADGTAVTPIAAAGTNVGTYTVTVTVTLALQDGVTNVILDPEKKTGSADISLTITKAKATVTTGSASKEYDGTPLTKTDGAGIEGLKGNDSATVTATGTITEVGNTPNTFTISWTAGSADNYEIEEKPGTLTVTENTAEITLTAPSDSKTYDGTQLTCDGTGEKKVTATGLPAGFTVEATAAGSRTDAGEGTNTVADGYVIKDKDGNDRTSSFTNIKKADGKLTVTKAPATVTTGSASKAYDGTPLTKADGAGITGLVNGETAAVTATGTITDVGNTPNTYTIAWGTAKKDNYEISEALGTLTITENTATITLTAPSDSKTYDGTPLTCDGTGEKKVTATGLPDGFIVEATATGSRTDAGSSSNVVDDGFVIKDASGADKTKNFKNVTKAPGTLTVNPKAATVITEPASKAYDGTPLTNPAGHIDGLAASDEQLVTVTGTGTITDVGSTPNTYTIDWGNALESNYTLTDNLGTLTVTPSTAEVVLTAASDSKTYDGTALTNSGVTASGLPEKMTVQATASGSQTDAGEGRNVVNDGYKIVDADGNDKTGNFSNITKVDGKLTVNPAAVTITTGTANKEYDGTPLTNDEAKIEGLADGESVTIKTTGTITEVGTAQNTYSINWDKAKESNYTVTENIGTLTITENTANVTLAASSANKTYDGTPLTSEAVTAAGLPEGFTVEAKAEGSQTDAGEGVNKVADGFIIRNAAGEDKTKSFTNVKKIDGKLTVTAASLTITSGSATKTYDGKALTCEEYEVTGLAEGETLTIEFTGSQTDAGSSENTFTVVWGDNTTAMANYLFGRDWAGVVSASDMRFAASGLTAGMRNSAGVQAKASLFADRIDIAAMDTAGTAGSAPKASNYKVTEVYGTLTVTARNVTLTSASDSKKYDGQPLTNEQVMVGGDGFVEGEVTGLKGTGKVTGVAEGAVKNTIAYTEGASFKADNYKITKTEGELSIEPRNVILTSGSATRVYDGNPLTNTAVEVAGDGFAPGEGASFSVTGTITNVGSAENAFSYTLNDGTAADNYKISVQFGTLTITGNGPVNPPYVPDPPAPEPEPVTPFTPGPVPVVLPPVPQVLGAARPQSGGAVLGAQRSVMGGDKGVLGAVRTGDDGRMWFWFAVMMIGTAVLVIYAVLAGRKRAERRR